MNSRRSEDYTDQELRELFHNDHRAAFSGYLRGSRHASDKQKFLRNWVSPTPTDFILECGSSSGKTSMDLARHGNCRCLGVDFDADAVRVSSALRDRHFPELVSRCSFVQGDLSTMAFPPGITKILMPDFTEHLPDRVFRRILDNMAAQMPTAELLIYTPCRSHVFEVLKHRNILLKNPSGHINVKTRAQLVHLLDDAGWRVTESSWHESSMWYMKLVERVLAPLPWIGPFFQRRLVIRARALSA